MFNQFSDRAKRAIFLARELAGTNDDANRCDFFMAVLLRMKSRALIDPQIRSVEQKYRYPEKSA